MEQDVLDEIRSIHQRINLQFNGEETRNQKLESRLEAIEKSYNALDKKLDLHLQDYNAKKAGAAHSGGVLGLNGMTKPLTYVALGSSLGVIGLLKIWEMVVAVVAKVHG